LHIAQPLSLKNGETSFASYLPPCLSYASCRAMVSTCRLIISFCGGAGKVRNVRTMKYSPWRSEGRTWAAAGAWLCHAPLVRQALLLRLCLFSANSHTAASARAAPPSRRALPILFSPRCKPLHCAAAHQRRLFLASPALPYNIFFGRRQNGALTQTLHRGCPAALLNMAPAASAARSLLPYPLAPPSSLSGMWPLLPGPVHFDMVLPALPCKIRVYTAGFILLRARTLALLPLCLLSAHVTAVHIATQHA